MDIIGALSSQLGVPADQAQALAGTVLGAVQSQVKEKLGSQTASELAGAVPEISGWQAQAQQLLGSGDGGGVAGALGGLLGGGGGGGLSDALGGLMGGAGGLAGMLGGGAETQALVSVLSKIGLDPAKATVIAPMAMQFLKSRLSPELMGTILKVVPFLSAGGGGDAGAGLAGMLGGLLGGKS